MRKSCSKDFNVADSFVINDKILNKFYYKLDEYQKEYYESILDDSIRFIGLNSPAGTGKTFIGIMGSLELLREGKVNHIYYIRVPDERSLHLGFLPGTEMEKSEIYFKPFYDIAIDLGIRPEEIDIARENDTVVLTTDICLRGTNIKKSAVIIDEAQNMDADTIKLILTRLHDDCKAMLIGHCLQCDNMKNSNHFDKYIEYMSQKNWAKRCELKKNYRGEMATFADSFNLK
ncbi:MAG: PhoH family protein [Bacilli bacterium]|nr:PhoH family protein [Bacilli bacterium]